MDPVGLGARVVGESDAPRITVVGLWGYVVEFRMTVDIFESATDGVFGDAGFVLTQRVFAVEWTRAAVSIGGGAIVTGLSTV